MSLSLATTEKWRGKESGEWKSNTEWHSIVIFIPKLCDIVEKYCKKGNPVYIEGMLETRKWTDKDGIDKHKTEIVLKGFNGKLIMLRSSRDEGRNEFSNLSSNEEYIVDKEDGIPF